MDETTRRARELPPIAPPKRVLRVVWSVDKTAVGRELPLDGQVWSIGRSATGAGCIQDGRISREHASIIPGAEPGSYLVKDNNSSNGTFLDGSPIDPARPAYLLAGQVLSVGGDTLLAVDQEVDPDSLPAGPDAVPDTAGAIVGTSFFADRLRRSVATVAAARGAVMLLGATGTGKEVAAQEIHRLGARPGAPFVSVNCAAIPPTLAESALFGHEKGAFSDAKEAQAGYFAKADGGVLFLDEVGDLPESLQPKLLRTLEDGMLMPLGAREPRKVEVRVVTATSLDVGGGQTSFRRDLLARLSVWVLRLCLLSERRSDILPLFQHFIRQRRPEAPDLACTGEFAEALLLYSWPSNVREVRNLVDRLVATVDRAKPFDVGHLPQPIQRPIRARSPSDVQSLTAARARDTISDLVPVPTDMAADGVPDRAALEVILREAEGNVAKAARARGWHVTQLRRWLSYAGLDPESFRKKRR